MSNNSTPKIQSESCIENPCEAIKLTIQPHLADLGDFSVRRALPVAQQRMVGPWVFFDHFGPVDFEVGKGIDVRPHPHIGIATVTYLFEGEIFHRDSLGNALAIRPGEMNLMVAGKGIVHSERETEAVRSSKHKLHGLQLWLALPIKDEQCKPSFHHYAADQLPNVIVGDVKVRVMVGEAYGVKSPVKTFARTLYAEADLKQGQSIVLPEEAERSVYVAAGEMMAKDSSMPEFTMTVFNPGDSIKLTAKTDARIAIIGGENISERHMFWNFVASSPELIEQGLKDWSEGRFAKVPGDEKEFIPSPGQ